MSAKSKPDGSIQIIKARNTSYRRIKVNGTWKKEHRHVMEVFLGRKLLPSEFVHHQDENGLNNHIENLFIISNSAHTILHRSFTQGQWARHYDTCANCGTTDRPHWGLGLCTACYRRSYYEKNPKAHYQSSRASYLRHKESRLENARSYDRERRKWRRKEKELSPE